MPNSQQRHVVSEHGDSARPWCQKAREAALEKGAGAHTYTWPLRCQGSRQAPAPNDGSSPRHRGRRLPSRPPGSGSSVVQWHEPWALPSLQALGSGMCITIFLRHHSWDSVRAGVEGGRCQGDDAQVRPPASVCLGQRPEGMADMCLWNRAVRPALPASPQCSASGRHGHVGGGPGWSPTTLIV